MSTSKPSPKRGGARPGAGRRYGSGVFGESTKALRVPISQLEAVTQLLSARAASEPLRQTFPLLGSRVHAGFPSPADDYVEGRIDLNEHLILHKEATFFLRVAGFSMLKAGIHDGDTLIVDRAIEPTHKKIVIAVVNGELTVKRLYKRAGKIMLLAENPDFAPIEFSKEDELVIWGVVTCVLHRV